MSNRPVLAKPGSSKGLDTDSNEEEGDWESDDDEGHVSDHATNVSLPKVDGDGFTTVKGRYSKHH